MTGAIGLSCSLPTDCVQGPYLASHPTRRTASYLRSGKLQGSNRAPTVFDGTNVVVYDTIEKSIE